MAGGRGRRQKGDRFERELVHKFQEEGFAAERIPLSGAMRGKFGGRDVSVPILGADWSIEAKHHENGFTSIYEWIDPVDILALRRNHCEPLIILRLDKFVDLIKTAEGRK